MTPAALFSGSAVLGLGRGDLTLAAHPYRTAISFVAGWLNSSAPFSTASSASAASTVPISLALPAAL